MSQTAPATSRGCHKCGQLGHWARDCTGAPPQDRPGEQETPGTWDAGEQAATTTTVGASRKRPKLTYDILKEAKGIPDVYNNFPSLMRAAFQGKGHEVSDTRRLLELYKRWSDRVFPSTGPNHSFDTFIADIENMSKSSIVKSDLHEMRENVLKVAVKESAIEEGNPASDGDQPPQDNDDDDAHDDDDELLQLAMEEPPDTNDAVETSSLGGKLGEQSPQQPVPCAEPAEMDDQALLDLLFED